MNSLLLMALMCIAIPSFAMDEGVGSIIQCLEQGQPFSEDALKEFRGQAMSPWPWVNKYGQTLLHIVALYHRVYQINSGYADYIMSIALQYHPWHLSVLDGGGKRFSDYLAPVSDYLARQIDKRTYWYYLEQYINVPNVSLADLQKILQWLGKGARNTRGESAFHLLLKNYGWHHLSHAQLRDRFALVSHYASVNDPMPDGTDPATYVQLAWRRKNGHWYDELDRNFLQLIREKLQVSHEGQLPINFIAQSSSPRYSTK